MPHRRDEIRKYVVDSLFDKTLCHKNVFDWRIRTVQNDHFFPFISVLTPKETITETSGNPLLLKREAELCVVISLLLGNHDENRVDEIVRQVEQIINNLNHPEFHFESKATEYSTENSTLKAQIFCCISYNCIYYTEEAKETDSEKLQNISISVTQNG